MISRAGRILKPRRPHARRGRGDPGGELIDAGVAFIADRPADIPDLIGKIGLG